MNKTINPVNNKLWKDFLVTISDEDFFNIIRNYLGPVQTPYNKHDLIEKLCLFIQRDEIQQLILDQVDTADMELLSVIDVLGAKSIEQLCTFFDTIYSQRSIYSRLLNLFDRLLILRHPEHRQFVLNPYFRAGLISRGLGKLTPPESTAHVDGKTIWFNDNIVIAALSIIKEQQETVCASGSLKKTLVSRFKQTVAAASGWTAEEMGIFNISLCFLGLLERKNQNCIVHFPHWKTFSILSFQQRFSYYCASYIVAMHYGQKYTEQITTMPIFQISEHIQPTAELLHPFIQSLKPTVKYSRIMLRQIITLHEAKALFPIETILSGLMNLSIIIQHEDGFVVNPELKNFLENNPEHSHSSLNVHSDYNITVHPRADFSEKITIASMCHLRICDNVCRFELTRESVFSGLALGIKRGEFLQILQRLDNTIPQNISFSIENWENEYFTVNIQAGYLLKVDKNAALVQNLAVRLKCVEDLGNGNFLFPADDLQWIEVLEDAGFAIRKLFNSVVNTYDPPLPPLTPFTEKPFPKIHREADRSQQREQQKRSAQRRHELEQQVEELNFTEDQKTDLKRRIQDGLLLIPEQFETAARTEITEASGLNYGAKMRLIETAIKKGNMLEISITGSKEIFLVRPVHITKNSRSDILHAVQYEEEIDIYVEKMRHIKRLSNNLFNSI